MHEAVSSMAEFQSQIQAKSEWEDLAQDVDHRNEDVQSQGSTSLVLKTDVSSSKMLQVRRA